MTLGLSRRTSFAAVAACLCAAAAANACAHLGVAKSSDHLVSAKERLAAIRHAKVWTATDVPSMDLRTGPRGHGAFAPRETVTCDYVQKKMDGNTPKFECALAPDDQVKVKFGRENGEVFAEVAATRLFWALGFGADRMYPVRVVCRGCPVELGGTPVAAQGMVFEYAAIERKMAGREIVAKGVTGWAWPELDLVDQSAGGATPAERDALKLLAVFIQHTDNKSEQQRLVCLDKSATKNVHACEETFMMVNDLGTTFGQASFFNRSSVSGANLHEWSKVDVWKDAKQCIANLPKSVTGTLENPRISEEGRRFLADRLAQLTDAQLHDLFDVSRFPDRALPGEKPGSTGSVDEWVDAFKRKRAAIVETACP